MKNQIFRRLSRAACLGVFASAAALGLALDARAQTSDQTSDAANSREPKAAQDKRKRQSDTGEVIVVGTSLKGGDAIGPVVVVTEEELDRTGALSLREALRTIPQNFSGVNNGDVAVWASGVNSVNARGAAVNLRGLGANYSLSLLNGRRFSSTGAEGASDVSQVPLAAIDRIEILTDGGSAIYGSDAVAGVVNFVLKERFEGVELSAAVGAAEGGYEQQQYSIVGGAPWSVGDEEGSALLSYEFFDQRELWASDRPSSATQRADKADYQLIPQEQRSSVFVALRQELGLVGTLEFNGLVTNREKSSRAYNSTVDGPVFQWAPTLALVTPLPDGWESEISLSHSQEDLLDKSRNFPSSFSRYDSKTATSSADGLIRRDGDFLDLAFGGQYREESYKIKTNGRYTRPEAGRYVSALFLEARLPLFRSDRDGSAILDFSASGRWENYSDFGDTINPKVGLRFSPTQRVQIGATWGTGFRAPLLSYLFGVREAQVYSGSFFVDTQSSTGRATSPVLVLLQANSELKPEESESFNISVNWAPSFSPRSRFKANYYEIALTDAIRTRIPGVPSNWLVDPQYASYVTRSPSAELVQSLLNQATSLTNRTGQSYSASNFYAIVDGRYGNYATLETSGLDATLDYIVPVGGAEIKLSLNANYIIDIKNQLSPRGASSSTVDTYLNPTRWQVRASGGFQSDSFYSTVTLNYKNAYDAGGNRGGAPIDDHLTADFSAGIELDTGASANLSIRNVTDEKPPVTTLVTTTFYPGYDPVNADAIGRIVTIKITKAF